MRPPSQIIQGETVIHSLINKESLQMESLQMGPPSQNYTRGNCRTLSN